MLFQDELDQLATLENVTIDEKATLSNGKSAKSVFCAGWPSARIVLEAISVQLKNPVVKILIGIIVKAGDALSSRICN